jgi:hypothetical protein
LYIAKQHSLITLGIRLSHISLNFGLSGVLRIAVQTLERPVAVSEEGVKREVRYGTMLVRILRNGRMGECDNGWVAKRDLGPRIVIICISQGYRSVILHKVNPVVRASLNVYYVVEGGVEELGAC